MSQSGVGHVCLYKTHHRLCWLLVDLQPWYQSRVPQRKLHHMAWYKLHRISPLLIFSESRQMGTLYLKYYHKQLVTWTISSMNIHARLHPLSIQCSYINREYYRWVYFDIKITRQGFENACWLHKAWRVIQHAFSKPSLVNWISKDTNMVFFLSVYPLFHSSN